MSVRPANHPPSLIRVFAVRMEKALVLSYPLSAQRRLWSEWADAQADLSLRLAYSHFVGFVMSWLKCICPTLQSRLCELFHYWQVLSCHHCRTCFSMGDLGVQVSVRLSVCSSVRSSVRPSTFTLGVLWAQILLQFCTNLFETLQVFSSWYEDVHVVWI